MGARPALRDAASQTSGCCGSRRNTATEANPAGASGRGSLRLGHRPCAAATNRRQREQSFHFLESHKVQRPGSRGSVGPVNDRGQADAPGSPVSRTASRYVHPPPPHTPSSYTSVPALAAGGLQEPQFTSRLLLAKGAAGDEGREQPRLTARALSWMWWWHRRRKESWVQGGGGALPPGISTLAF